MRVYNAHCADRRNVGDMNSAPSLYYPLGKRVGLNADIEPGSLVIIGGGGLLHPCFDASLRRIVNRAGKIIVWAIGTNSHSGYDLRYPSWLENCALVGIRDYLCPYHWLPCVSCMSPLFDIPYERKHPVVVYKHSFERREIPDAEGLPTLKNNAPFEKSIAFLASAEVVVTNTYHGAYWATLLGCKAIVYPFATRFFLLKHRPVVMSHGQSWRRGVEYAQTYSGALDECRQANRTFYAECDRIING